MANAWIIAPRAVTGVTASSTAIGVPGNVANDYAGVVWQSGSGTQIDLIVDLGTDVTIDTALIFGLALAPASATLQVFASTAAAGPGFSPPTWSGAAASLYAGTVAKVVGGGVALWSAPAGFPAAVRYLLLRFANATAFSVQASRVAIGKRLLLERNFSLGGSLGVRDLGSLDFNRRGVLQRTRGKKLRTAGLTFSGLHKDEVEAQTKPLLEQIGNTEMVALVSDPSADPQRQNRCYFGPLVGDLSHTWRKADAFEAKVNLVSIF